MGVIEMLKLYPEQPWRDVSWVIAVIVGISPAHSTRFLWPHEALAPLFIVAGPANDEEGSFFMEGTTGSNCGVFWKSAGQLPLLYFPTVQISLEFKSSQLRLK